MRPSPEVCQPQPQSTAIDRSARFQLLSERVDTISHTGEACRKDSEQRRDCGKQEDGRERDLDDVRDAVDAVEAENLSPSCSYRVGFEKTYAIGSIAAIPRPPFFKTPLTH